MKPHARLRSYLFISFYLQFFILKINHRLSLTDSPLSLESQSRSKIQFYFTQNCIAILFRTKCVLPRSLCSIVASVTLLFARLPGWPPSRSRSFFLLEVAQRFLLALCLLGPSHFRIGSRMSNTHFQSPARNSIISFISPSIGWSVCLTVGPSVAVSSKRATCGNRPFFL